MNIGWERKIGYSFCGLVAGNAASFVVLLLIAVLQLLHEFSLIKKVWNVGMGEAWSWSLVIGIYSIAAWVVVGLPVVLLLHAEIVANFYWLTAVLVGAVLGTCAMLLIIFALSGGRVDLAFFLNLYVLVPFYFASFIAGVAFAVYCSLVKWAFRRQSKENGAPGGTPRSLAWFDF